MFDWLSLLCGLRGTHEMLSRRRRFVCLIAVVHQVRYLDIRSTVIRQG